MCVCYFVLIYACMNLMLYVFLCLLTIHVYAFYIDYLFIIQR
jgi:hypothetical protein